MKISVITYVKYNIHRTVIGIIKIKYSRDLAGAEEQQRNNGRVHVAVDNETHLVQSAAKIAAIPRQLSDTFLTYTRPQTLSVTRH
jgi:hypothetical protein